jgi:hypothetical protein
MLLQCPALAGSEAKARKIDLKAIEQAVDREQAARKAKAGSVPNSKRENTPARRPVTSHPAVRSKARKAG